MRWMWRKWILVICLLVVAACVMAGFAEKAWAARGIDGIEVGQYEGEGTKVITAEPPTKKEIAVGVGSVVVAILVLKYL